MSEHDEGGNGKAGAAIALEPFDFLSGNVKGPYFEHKLESRCVAFRGPNRRGKTRRLEAFKLAWDGRHPVGPHGTNMVELMADGALSLEATISAGPRANPRQASTFHCEIESGKVRVPEKPERVGTLRLLERQPNSEELLDSCLPSKDLIGLGKTLSREAIFRRFGAITTMPVPRGLTDVQLAFWEEGIAACREDKPKADTAELLALASAWFRREKLAAGREIKALGGVVAEQEAALKPQIAGAEELPQLKAQLTLARAWEGSVDLRAAKARIDADVVAYRAKVTPLREADQPEVRATREAEHAAQEEERRSKITGLTSAKSDAAVALGAWAELAASARAALETSQRSRQDASTERYTKLLEKELEYLHGGTWLKECLHRMESKIDANGNAPCLLCGTSVNVAAIQAQLEPRITARAASVAALKLERDEALAALVAEYERDSAALTEEQRKARAAHEARINETEAALRVAEVELANWRRLHEETRRTEEQQKALLKAEYDRLKSTMEQNQLALKAVPEAYAGPTAAELDARIEALKAADAKSRALDEQTRKLRELVNKQEIAKTLEGEAAKELDDLLQGTVRTANNAVNARMPTGFKAALDLESAQWTVIGADGRPHGKKTMSGSELGALVPATALTWAAGAPGTFLLLDDEDVGAFDQESFTLLLTALKEATDTGLVTMVLLATWRTDLPPGWQVINIDEDAPRAATEIDAALGMEL